MALVHFCSKCDRMAQLDGVWPHAVTCPTCGHTERQHAHARPLAESARIRDEYAAAQGHLEQSPVVEARGVLSIGGSARKRAARKAAAARRAP